VTSRHHAPIAIDMGSPTAQWARETVRLLLAEPLTSSGPPTDPAFPHREWVKRLCTVLEETSGSTASERKPSTEESERVIYLFVEAMHHARVGWKIALVTAQLAEFDEHSSFEMMTSLVDQWELEHGWPVKPGQET
jgi:hypothetical protein